MLATPRNEDFIVVYGSLKKESTDIGPKYKLYKLQHINTIPLKVLL